MPLTSMVAGLQLHVERLLLARFQALPVNQACLVRGPLVEATVPRLIPLSGKPTSILLLLFDLNSHMDVKTVWGNVEG